MGQMKTDKALPAAVRSRESCARKLCVAKGPEGKNGASNKNGQSIDGAHRRNRLIAEIRLAKGATYGRMRIECGVAVIQRKGFQCDLPGCIVEIRMGPIEPGSENPIRSGTVRTGRETGVTHNFLAQGSRLRTAAGKS